MSNKKKSSRKEATPAFALDHSTLLSMLGYHLHCADARFTQRFRATVTAHFAINPAEFAVLCMLESNKAAKSKQLSAELGIAAPNLAVLLAGLERRHLIERIPDTRDGRSMHLELTASGKTFLRKVRAIVESGETELMNGLTEAQKKALFDLLQRIHRVGL